MSINWKLRLTNRATLAALAAAAVAFAYQVAGIVGVEVPLAQDEVVSAIGAALTLLCALGIVTDPTTAGVSDSSRALGYERPAATSGESPEGV